MKTKRRKLTKERESRIWRLYFTRTEYLDEHATVLAEVARERLIPSEEAL